MRPTLGGAVMALAVVGAIICGVVAIHELNYASDHPYAFGPAHVIAWLGIGGAILSVAVGLLGRAVADAGSGSQAEAREP